MSAERVDLPSGAWVALKDPKHVTIRHRRPVLRAFGRVRDAEEDPGLVDDLTAATGAALIAQWSFEQPVSEDAILDAITAEDANVLGPKLLKLAEELMPKFDEPDPDPASPTEPSGASSAS